MPRREQAAPRVLLVLALLLVVAASACGVDRSSEGSVTSTSGGSTTTEDRSTTTSSVTSTSTDTSSTSESSTTTAPTTTTTEAPPPTFTEYAHIATWYTPAEADDSEWVHFKAVDEGGYTVAEVLGSDLMNMVDEANAMAQTSARVDLVDRLRQQMVDDGWTEIGVDGDWYEYQFGR